jgi:hypothetical protein
MGSAIIARFGRACLSTEPGHEDFLRNAGAVKKTRTSTGCPAATSRQCVYQFRHDRKNRLEDEGGDVTEGNRVVKGAENRP